MNPLTFWSQVVLARIWPWSHHEPLFEELEGADLAAFMREMYPPTFFDPPPGSIVLTLPLLDIDYSD